MADFNTVVLRKVEIFAAATCVRLVVHPFPVPAGIYISLGRGHYGDSVGKDEMPQWQRELVDELWDKVPGVQDVILANGSIQLAHAGLFGEAEITEAVIAIVRPYLENQLALMRLAEAAEGE